MTKLLPARDVTNAIYILEPEHVYTIRQNTEPYSVTKLMNLLTISGNEFEEYFVTMVTV